MDRWDLTAGFGEHTVANTSAAGAMFYGTRTCCWGLSETGRLQVALPGDGMWSYRLALFDSLRSALPKKSSEQLQSPAKVHGLREEADE